VLLGSVHPAPVIIEGWSKPGMGVHFFGSKLVVNAMQSPPVAQIQLNDDEVKVPAHLGFRHLNMVNYFAS
jgi:hypothetical protein